MALLFVTTINDAAEVVLKDLDKFSKNDTLIPTLGWDALSDLKNLICRENKSNSHLEVPAVEK